MSDSVRPQRRQLTRLPCLWDSLGKNTGVGCHFLFQCMKVKSESEVTQLCPTPSDPMDCSLPGSSVHGLFQARVLEWGAIAFSDNKGIHHLILEFSRQRSVYLSVLRIVFLFFFFHQRWKNVLSPPSCSIKCQLLPQNNQFSLLQKKRLEVFEEISLSLSYWNSKKSLSCKSTQTKLEATSEDHSPHEPMESRITVVTKLNRDTLLLGTSLTIRHFLVAVMVSPWPLPPRVCLSIAAWRSWVLCSCQKEWCLQA